MDILIVALLAALIVICVILLVVSIKNKPQKSDTAQEIKPVSDKLENLSGRLDFLTNQTDKSLKDVTRGMQELTEKNYRQMLKINETLAENADKQAEKISASILKMQDSNEKKLDEMRKTVDEKLSETLNQRLNASFKTVSEQLSNVYKSLGEMKELSSGVTDNVKSLNKVLTNVKARGTWAEVQLGNILDETIPGMYDTNVKTNPAYDGRVEFAVRIPGKENDEITYLPIDSKFPMEDYIRLSAAAENGNYEELEKARKALETRVKDEAKLVKKYVAPPSTTPFAILYLATEGLYAEIASGKSGIAETLQAQGVMIAGPSTITALLNSLAMGFRTIAINKKANEVWKVLGAAKTQYEKFADLLTKARKKIDEAGKVLDDADKRNNIIQKNLKSVETLETNAANDILGIEE
ncbi:MAG TPA: DNA recombination protein RmuC [Candidatus Eubacterium faecipullorum]|uniref:DNA recombination protein RmuC n=1 Tax=Candidatus Eubacterium faecipullorum TaxID=2838571 RepID=A0A9D1REG2_9FIRM|nr:DNA recombination protein RmuC [Candidatus Eubacterium faecipullorum]